MAQAQGTRIWRVIAHHEPEMKLPMYRKYLDEEFVAIGWPMGDLRKKPEFDSRMSVYRFLLEHPEAMTDHKGKHFTNYWFGAVSLWAFYREMKVNDLIILRTGQTPDRDLGKQTVVKIVGDYSWNPATDDEPRLYQHRLKIKKDDDYGPNELDRRAGGLDRDWYVMDAPDAELERPSQQQWQRCTVLPYRVTL